MQNTHSLALHGVDFSWPDGRRILRGLDASFSAGRTGLVGPNGTGKSVLLRLFAGELQPTAGTVATASTPAYLPQKLTLRSGRSVASLLGIEERRRALRSVLDGTSTDLAADLEAIGVDWDIEERSVALMAGYGLPVAGPDFLDRTVGTLSGGESMVVALAGLELAARPITLLDEPTNNLDRSARKRLFAAIGNWRGTLLVASHDPELLDLVDAIAELKPVDVRSGVAGRAELHRYGGNREHYLRATEVERRQAEQRVRDAAARMSVERRQQADAETAMARRARQGRKAADSMPRILANGRRNRAEASAGSLRSATAESTAAARDELSAARDALPPDTAISIDLPGTRVPAGRTLLDVPVAGVARGTLMQDGRALVPEDGLALRGPQWVRLAGPNGAGKTTLLRAVAEAARVPVGFLRQRLDHDGDGWAGLDPNASVVENVRRVAPAASPEAVRNRLAHFHFRGARVGQPAGQLSGGEMFRVALARILLADPAPQLLLLDEPTNNLDRETTGQLLGALRSYEGGLIVTSHDDSFVASLAVGRSNPLQLWELQRAVGPR